MLFRRLFLTRLIELHEAGRLAFFGTQSGLADRRLFLRHLASVRKKRFVVYAKPPFSGPEAVLAYLRLYPPGRHLQPASDCLRQDRRHLPLQGLSPRWSRAAARHDARAARVHPPLPAPCPATWLPPHPALRLARQFRTQGQYCACPRTACRGTATRACRSARTTRLAPTLSLLWRTHDHHRDLRAMGQPRAPPHAPASTGSTRRDPARLALTSRRNTTVTTNAPIHALHQDHRERTEYQPWPDPDPRAARRKISLTRPPPVPAPSRFRHLHNQAKLEIPIDHRRNPAGSCLGGFRTPAPCPDARPAMAGIRKPSPLLAAQASRAAPPKRTSHCRPPATPECRTVTTRPIPCQLSPGSRAQSAPAHPRRSVVQGAHRRRFAVPSSELAST